jgi:taurine transport system substrate-binding protein
MGEGGDGMIWLKIITAAVLSGSLFAVVETVLPSRPLQPFTIEISDWPGDQIFALIEPLGLTASLPVRLDLRRAPPSRDPVQAFRDGLVDAVSVGLDRVPELLAEGGRVIYALDEVTGEGGLVAASDFATPAGLRGRKIGVAFGRTLEPLAVSLLDHAGVDPQDVTLVPLAPDRLGAALQSGRVAAVVAVSPSGLALLRQRPGVVPLALTSAQPEAAPIEAGLVTHVLVVRESRIPDQRDSLRAILRVLSEAVGMCRKTTDPCLTLMATASGRSADAWRQDFEAVHLLDLADNQTMLAGGAEAPVARRLVATVALLGHHGARSALPSTATWLDSSLVEEAARP